ncbi:2Fe-2S iron-sulfur cluster-binding protein [Ekhidna sp. To15]|uniref:2Fe-2S iron-sulfur cluster-binding protein n=1 Tax=Ekhidna sp. To15 TaxID=3395267 RepID=UPI003F5274EC
MAFSLFKKNKKKTDDRYQVLTIKEVVNVAKDAVNLVFEKPESFDYEPGQFITIIKEVNGKKIRRAYSLCTTPFEDENPAVTVKRVDGGAMSNDLNDHAKAGDQLEIMEPMGMFTTEYNDSNKRNAIFFGGGSGITPLMSIIRSVLLKEPKSTTTLIYGNRTKEFVIFNELIAELEAKYPQRFKAIHILEDGEADYSGRPTPDMIGEICTQLSADSKAEFYICGPQPMMDVVSTGLDQFGIDKEAIRMESFEAGKTSPAEIIDKKAVSESEVTILLDGEEYSITVKSSASILDTALDNDLDMPYSCQSGLCTACRGKCVEGKISIDEAEGLSQDELDEGYVLTCVGKPLTDRVKVEMG